MLKEQKGITLVALIITIIVMLILAGVSISLVVGEGGVLTQAQDVEPKQVAGALQEAISLANADMMATYYGDTSADKDKAVLKCADIIKVIEDNFSYSGKYPIAFEETADNSTTSTNAADDVKEILKIELANIDLDPDTDAKQSVVKMSVEKKGADNKLVVLKFVEYENETP